jgi:hypothetical protein
MQPTLRIARPATDLPATTKQWTTAFDLQVLAEFNDHAGFDGVMLGRPGGGYHFEFTVCRAHPVQPAPTAEDLVVFYLPEKEAWEHACERALHAGLTKVQSFNPYWDESGATFADRDGYRVVLQNAAWSL